MSACKTCWGHNNIGTWESIDKIALLRDKMFIAQISLDLPIILGLEAKTLVLAKMISTPRNNVLCCKLLRCWNLNQFMMSGSLLPKQLRMQGKQLTRH